MIKGFCFFIFIGKMIVNFKLNKYFCILDVVNTPLSTTPIRLNLTTILIYYLALNQH